MLRLRGYLSTALFHIYVVSRTTQSTESGEEKKDVTSGNYTQAYKQKKDDAAKAAREKAQKQNQDEQKRQNDLRKENEKIKKELLFLKFKLKNIIHGVLSPHWPRRRPPPIWSGPRPSPVPPEQTR